MDRHPLSFAHLSLIHHGPKRRREATSEAGADHEADGVRQADQVDVREIHRHEFGERTPMCETRLELTVTNLVVALQAVHTLPATATERQRYALSRAPFRYISTHCLHDAGEFVTRHMRSLDHRVMAHPTVPVTPAQAGGANPDHNAVFSRHGIRSPANRDGIFEFVKDRRSHGSRGFSLLLVDSHQEQRGQSQYGKKTDHIGNRGEGNATREGRVNAEFLDDNRQGDARKRRAHEIHEYRHRDHHA